MLSSHKPLGHDSQLRVDKCAAVATVRHGLDQLLDPLQKIFWIRGSCVAPFALILALLTLLLRGRDVDTTEFSAHNGCTGKMLSTTVRARDFGNKKISPSLLVQNGIKVSACLLQLGSIRIIVESGEIGTDVLPTTIVVDAARAVEAPIYKLSVNSLGICLARLRTWSCSRERECGCAAECYP